MAASENKQIARGSLLLLLPIHVPHGFYFATMSIATASNIPAAPSPGGAMSSNAQQMAAFMGKWETITQLSDSQYNSITKVCNFSAQIYCKLIFVLFFYLGE